MTRIQDGVYPAHLIGSEVKLSSKGLPMLTLQWQLETINATLKSHVHVSLADGSPNVKGIGLVRKWAPDWDGNDLYWFSEHLEIAGKYPVKLTVVNEPSWADPGILYAKVKWVNPANWRPTGSAPVAPTQIDESASVRPAPDAALEPTMHDTWRMWCAMTENCSRSYRDKTWIWYARETAADRDQVDFTADDWARMQQRILLTGRRTTDNN